jgi:hypothetical protein
MYQSIARGKMWAAFHFSFQYKMYHKMSPTFFRVRYSGSAYVGATLRVGMMMIAYPGDEEALGRG